MAFLESARVINLKIKAIAFPQKNKDSILVAKIGEGSRITLNDYLNLILKFPGH